MSLDIGVLVEETSLTLDPGNTIFFDDDGYYWFLRPIFEELHKKTGEMIDLYGGAIFKAENLILLNDTIETALRLVQKQPPQWEVYVGTQTQPVKKELYSTVVREDFVSLLQKFQKLVIYAMNHEAAVLCLGD